MFRGAWTRAIETSDERVRGAIYSKPDHAVLVLANTTASATWSARWRLNLSEIGWSEKVTLKLTTANGQHTEKIVSGEQLGNEGLLISLEPLEYRVIEVQPT